MGAWPDVDPSPRARPSVPGTRGFLLSVSSSPLEGSGVTDISGAQSLVRSLEEIGVEVVFGIPGGAILPAYDPLFDSQRLRHILVRHEQGAGHAATGYAQATAASVSAWRPAAREPPTW